MKEKARRRLRSRLNFEILRTLALEVGGPVLLAEYYRLYKLGMTGSPEYAMNLLARKEYFYSYLYRLARRGLVKFKGLRRQRRIYLTEEGLMLLKEAGFETSGQGKPQERSDQERRDVPPKSFHRVAKRAGRSAPDDRFEKLRQALGRLTAAGRKEAFFVSYDVPQRMRVERDRARRFLKAAGFLDVNQSFYVGPKEALKRAVERMEEMKLLPFCCWGSLRVFPR